MCVFKKNPNMVRFYWLNGNFSNTASGQRSRQISLVFNVPFDTTAKQARNPRYVDREGENEQLV